MKKIKFFKENKFYTGFFTAPEKLCFSFLTRMLLFPLIVSSVAGCSSHGNTSSQTESAVKPASIPVDTQTETPSYSLEEYTENIFQGDTVYYESIIFSEEKDGSIKTPSLLYKPTEILGVYSADFKTRYTYGKDYVIDGKKLEITDNSSIPIWKYEMGFIKKGSDEAKKIDSCYTSLTDKTSLVKVTSDIVKYQVAVSYKHEVSNVPDFQKSQVTHLPKTMSALKSGQKLNIVLLGDSITAGCEASGQRETIVDIKTLKEFDYITTNDPLMPSWSQMTVDYLSRKYNCEITKTNSSALGTATGWAIENYKSLVCEKNPDLVFVNYGGNQTQVGKDAFKADMKTIIEGIHADCPNAEFVICSCPVINADTVLNANDKLQDQENADYELQAELTDINIAVVPVNTTARALLDMGKTYSDITANNHNHPNDFLIRVYAQAVLKAFGE